MEIEGPLPSKCDPTEIAFGGSRILNLTGANLDDGAAVQFVPSNGASSHLLTVKVLRYLSRTQIEITVYVDEAPFGNWDIKVTNHDGQSRVLTNAIHVIGRIEKAKPLC